MWSSIFQRKADDAFRQAMDTASLAARARLIELAAYYLRMAAWPVAQQPTAEARHAA